MDQNELTPSEQEEPETGFNMRIWGYDRGQVDSRLAELQRQIDVLEAERRDVAALGPDLVGVGEKVEQVIAAARDAAASARSQAAEQAAELSRESEQAAERLRSEVDEYATKTRRAADDYEKRIRSEAERQAEELKGSAETEAHARTTAAEEEADEILREARLERARIEEGITELRERRQQVIASIERLQGSLKTMVGEAEKGTAQFAAVQAVAEEVEEIETGEEETIMIDAGADGDSAEAALPEASENGAAFAEAETAEEDYSDDDSDDGPDEEQGSDPDSERRRRVVFDDTAEQSVRTEDL